MRLSFRMTMDHRAAIPRPNTPPKAHFLTPDVDLYNKPVAPPLKQLFSSSSSSRNCDIKTYIEL